jgi:hypothetical protein
VLTQHHRSKGKAMIDIEKLAREAGFTVYNGCCDGITSDLERFAVLVLEAGHVQNKFVYEENKQLRKELNRAKGIKDVPALLKGTDDQQMY